MNHQHRIAAAGSGVAALALASCLALTGCAGGQSAGSAASRPRASAPALPSLSLPSAGPAQGDRSLSGIHACSLVPASVVTQVLGALSEPPSGDGLLCVYNTQLSAEEGGPSYILTVFTRSGYEAAKAFATGAAESGATQFASVAGLWSRRVLAQQRQRGAVILAECRRGRSGRQRRGGRTRAGQSQGTRTGRDRTGAPVSHPTLGARPNPAAGGRPTWRAARTRRRCRAPRAPRPRPRRPAAGSASARGRRWTRRSPG